MVLYSLDFCPVGAMNPLAEVRRLFGMTRAT